MAIGAKFLAFTSIPEISIPTFNAGFFGGRVTSSGTDGNTSSIVAVDIAGTVRALASDKEDILEREVLGKSLAGSQIKDKFAPRPGGGERKSLRIIIDYKSSKAMETGIISADIYCGGVDDFV